MLWTKLNYGVKNRDQICSLFLIFFFVKPQINEISMKLHIQRLS